MGKIDPVDIAGVKKQVIGEFMSETHFPEFDRTANQAAGRQNGGEPDDILAARFDDRPSLKKLKKLQDPSFFGKARFGFRLYNP